MFSKVTETRELGRQLRLGVEGVLVLQAGRRGARGSLSTQTADLPLPIIRVLQPRAFPVRRLD